MEDNGVAIQPSFRDSAVFHCCPGVEIETPGYFHEFLRDRLLQNFRETLPLVPPDEFMKVAKLTPLRHNQVAILVNRSAVR